MAPRTNIEQYVHALLSRCGLGPRPGRQLLRLRADPVPLTAGPGLCPSAPESVSPACLSSALLYAWTRCGDSSGGILSQPGAFVQIISGPHPGPRSNPLKCDAGGAVVGVNDAAPLKTVLLHQVAHHRVVLMGVDAQVGNDPPGVVHHLSKEAPDLPAAGHPVKGPVGSSGGKESPHWAAFPVLAIKARAMA